MPAPRHVVLPQGLGATPPPKSGSSHHADAWHQFEGLVFVLVGIHVAAFAFWCWLLWSSRRNKQAAAESSSAAAAAAAAAAMAASSGVATAGRSTRDLLRSYHKATIGKG